MIFLRKPIFGISIMLNLFLYATTLPVYQLEVFKYPYAYIFTIVSFLIPILYAVSRKLIINENCLTVSLLWGLIMDRYDWNEIEEGYYIRNSNFGRTDSNSVSPIANWVGNILAPATIKLIISEKDPLVFDQHLHR